MLLMVLLLDHLENLQKMMHYIFTLLFLVNNQICSTVVTLFLTRFPIFLRLIEYKTKVKKSVPNFS